MKRLEFRDSSVPLALLTVCMLAFGLLVPWLGFYQDDWYQMWFERTFGAGIWPAYYARERPFIAGLYMLTTPFLGTSPLGWHIFALFTRWLAALAVWQTLRLVWPRRAPQVAWITLLFAVYPGFRQQFAAVIYSHYFLQLTIHMASFAAMLLAIRKPRWFWPLTIFSLAGALFSLFTSEYFFGFEVMRPFLLLVALGAEGLPTWQTRLKAALVKAWPYLAITLAFLLWRVVVFKFPTYQPVFLQAPSSALLSTLKTLLVTILKDAAEMGAFAWVLPLRLLPGLADRQPSSLAAVALAALSSLLLAGYLWKYRPTQAMNRSVTSLDEQTPTDDDRYRSGSLAVGLLALGAIGLFGAGIPFWFVGLPVDTGLLSGSRFGISFMLPASLLLVGAIESLNGLRPRKISAAVSQPGGAGIIHTVQLGIVAAVVGLAIGHHFKDANFYRQVHRSQATFFQHLAWRAPGLKPGTLVLTNTFEDVLLSGDNSLTAALNWIYDPSPPYALDYMLFYIPSRIESHNLTSLEKGVPVIKDFRTTQFTGSTSQALVIYYDSSRCLRVLDPEIDTDITRPIQMPRELKEMVNLSNLDLVIPDSAPPAELPGDLFKYKPTEQSWCYYFEKADLARQRRDWAAIAVLGDQAFREGFQTASAWELAPFIEGYARSGSLQQALELTDFAFDNNIEARWQAREILCAAWERIGRASEQKDSSKALQAAREKLACP